MTEYVVGPADSRPPGRYISGEGYAHYQVQVNGTTYTVQEHQLVAILHGADPMKVFSNGDYHVHHKHSVESCPIGERERLDGEFEPIHGWRAVKATKQLNYGRNLELKEAEEHALISNGKDY